MPTPIDTSQDVERLTFMLRLADTLQSLPVVSAVQEAACHMLAQQLQAERAYYATVDRDQQKITIDSEYSPGNARNLAGKYPLNTLASVTRLLEEGQPFICDDTHTSALLDPPGKAFHEARLIASFMAFPLTNATYI